MVPQGAPPPKWMRLKCVSSRIPRPRMMSFSGFVSMVNVESPLTSRGSTPASSQAAVHASSASCSSLRLESFENSVAPIPTPPPPARDRLLIARATGQQQLGGAAHVVTELVRSPERDRDLARGRVDG